MADPQSPKQSLEITVPVEEVEAETERVVESLQKKVRIAGFRPGKVPRDLIRSRYGSEIRQDVLEKLVPRHFYDRAEKEGLAVVGTPDIKDVHFEKGEPLKFTADFEIAPTIELKEYKGLTVPYQEPEIADEDIQKRLDQLREQKAEYVNVDPRPLAAGDHAVVSLESVSGVEQPIKQDELVLEIGGESTLADFTNNLTGAAPGDEREFDVTYPEEYGQPKIAGKTIRFHAAVKGVRRKEVPEVNDDFARDLGDYQNVEELREAIRKAIFSERQFFAEQEAKNKLVEQMVDAHEFAVPEAFVEHQIELSVRRQLEMLAAEGVDPRTIKLDWEKVKESQREKAVRDVKASLLINKVADAEQIFATQEEVDRELQRLARQEREPVAATRKRLEKEDGIRRIANRLRTEKTLTFLFEQARKEAPAETPTETPAAE